LLVSSRHQLGRHPFFLAPVAVTPFWTNGRRSPLLYCPRVSRDNDMVRRLMWSGLMAGIGALATIAANRLATVVWRRLFDEDPPE